MLALSLLFVSLPLVVAPAGADQRPCFSLDICHPAQALGAASVQCALPVPSNGVSPPALRAYRMTSRAADAVVALAPGPPDTPPPKF